MLLGSNRWLCFCTLLAPISAGVLPRQSWNTFTYPAPYNGSSRAIYKAGSTINITWKPGVLGPNGPITIILTGGILNTTIPPEIASGIDNTVGSYAWTIPTVLPQYSYYDLEILLDSNPNMFSQADAEFVISGLNPTTTSSATSATQTSQTTSGLPSSTASTSATSPEPTQSPLTTSGDLSLGAKIGIGVGAGVVGVLLLILLSLFMFRRGKRATQKEQSQTTAEGDKADTPLKDIKVSEMESTRPMGELQGSTVLAELDGGSGSRVVRKPLPGMQETNQKFLK